MDVDSLLEHDSCNGLPGFNDSTAKTYLHCLHFLASSPRLHPAEEFLAYKEALYEEGFESAAEVACNASEGFQGLC